jgi:predicted nucleic acid-binding protein
MIIPDINLPLYAYDLDSPFHARAAEWWQRCLSGTEQVEKERKALKRLAVLG